MFKYLKRLWKRWIVGKSRTVMVGTFIAVAHDVDGSELWRSRAKVFRNGDCTAGLNDMLNVYFDAGSQKTSWYIGLLDDDAFSALSAADTSAAHAGWAELTDYSEGVRQTWNPSAASAGVMTGPAVTFSINATVDVNGAFLISNSTKGGTTGILFATGSFDTPQSLVNGQSLTVIYEKDLTPE